VSCEAAWQGLAGQAGIGDPVSVCNAQICRRCAARRSISRWERWRNRCSGLPILLDIARRAAHICEIETSPTWRTGSCASCNRPIARNRAVSRMALRSMARADGSCLRGQAGGDEKGDYQPDMAGQVGVALHRIITLLAEAGAGPGHIVRLIWYLTSCRCLQTAI
jgi:hypothetical protein